MFGRNCRREQEGLHQTGCNETLHQPQLTRTESMKHAPFLNHMLCGGKSFDAALHGIRLLLAAVAGLSCAHGNRKETPAHALSRQ